MNTETETNMIQRIGSEDIRVKDYVTVTRTVVELLPYPCDLPSTPKDIEPYRACITPRYSGQPFKVVGVCLPYVLVEDASGKPLTLDTRRQGIARLSKAFGKQAMKRYRREHDGRKSGGKKKRHR